MGFLETMKSGELYDCSNAAPDEASARQLAECKELLYDFNHARPSEEAKKEALLRRLFASTGAHYYVEPPLHANWGCNTHIGENFYSNFNLTLVDDADIYIGDNVMIAPNVVLTTGAHPICPELRAKGYQYNKSIHIGHGVWLGAGVIVLPGVTIGENSVIGAGSVVTRDIPANVVAVGTPCRVMRPIIDRDRAFYDGDRPIPESAGK